MHITAIGLSRVSLMVAVLGVCFAKPTIVRAATRLGVVASGTCPTRESVIAAIQGALPDVAITGDDAETVPRAVVEDDGPRFRVTFGSVERVFIDWPPRCEARAHKVAVLVALELEPPVIALRPPAIGGVSAPPPLEIAPPEPPSEPSSELAVQIESGAVVDAAPLQGGFAALSGADLRIAIGRRNRQVVVGGAVIGPMKLPIPGMVVGVHRLPIDLAVRARLGSDRIAAVFDVGPRVTIQRIATTDAMRPSARTLEAGARLAVRLELQATQLCGIYVLVHGEYIPRPSERAPVHYAATMDPLRFADLVEMWGMPSLWVGMSVGLTIRVR